MTMESKDSVSEVATGHEQGMIKKELTRRALEEVFERSE